MKTNVNKEIIIKPKAHSISSWDSRKEILYACPKCNADFRILGQRIKYCFNCGVKINWDVLTYLSESIDSLYNKHRNKGHTDLSQDEFEKELVKTINERQGY